MFDEKQIEQYRAVKASPELKARVEAVEKRGKIYSFNRAAVSAIAACLVAVIAIGSYAAGYGSIEAELVNGSRQTAAFARAAQQSISIRLSVKGEYEVSVSSGSISAEGCEPSQTITPDGECEAVWCFEPYGEHILTVKKGLIIRQYRLFVTQQGWQLENV